LCESADRESGSVSQNVGWTGGGAPVFWLRLGPAQHLHLPLPSPPRPLPPHPQPPHRPHHPSSQPQSLNTTTTLSSLPPRPTNNHSPWSLEQPRSSSTCTATPKISFPRKLMMVRAVLVLCPPVPHRCTVALQPVCLLRGSTGGILICIIGTTFAVPPSFSPTPTLSSPPLPPPHPGIANCAKEQADAWRATAKEEGQSSATVDKMIRLIEQCAAGRHAGRDGGTS
jgi:hypothetical protein